MPRYVPRRPHRVTQLTERDSAILETIYHFDGLMSRRQLRMLFFPESHPSTARRRLRRLYDAGYLGQPDAETKHIVPPNEWLYWLARPGYRHVAHLEGREPTQTELRRAGPPGWASVRHHLGVNDFRIAVLYALHSQSLWELVEWATEQQFRRWKPRVTLPNGQGRKHKRVYVPDGFFMVHHAVTGKRLAYLLEYDRATESHTRLEREKVQAGLAFLQSQHLRERFGVRYARILTVTTSLERLENWRRRAAEVDKRGKFLFGVADQVLPDPLAAPVWRRTTDDQPQPLLAAA